MSLRAWFVDPNGDAYPTSGANVQYVDQFTLSVDSLCVKVEPWGDFIVEIDGTPPEQLIVEKGLYVRQATKSKLESRWRKEQAGAAGDIEVVVRNQKGVVVCRSTLTIRPANFSEAELQRLLDEIGQLALSQVTRVWARGLRVEPRDSLDSGSIAFEALEKCLQTWMNVWHGIERAPLRAHSIVLGHTSINTALRRPNGIRAVLSNPGRQRVVSPTIVETTNCTENQWVLWALAMVIRPTLDALLLSTTLAAEQQVDDRKWILSRLDIAIEQWKLPDAVQFREKLGKAMNKPGTSIAQPKLRALLSQVNTYLQSSLFDGLNPPLEEPIRTERLISHSLYGALVKGIDDCFGEMTRSLSRAATFLGRIRAGQIKSTWRCYEIWCLLALIDSFQRLARFEALSANDWWINRLAERDGELSLDVSRARPVTLQRSKDDLLDQIELMYEPKIPSLRGADGNPITKGVRTLTPDFLFHVMRSDTSTHRMDSFYVVMDAKYRDYSKQREVMAEDAWTVCRAKYLEGFREASRAGAAGSVMPRAVFVLHSNPPRADSSEYWGEQPLRNWLQSTGARPDFVGHGIGDTWQNHSIGLLPFRPDFDRVRISSQIIDLWFTYYCQNAKSSAICPRCAYRLKPGKDTRFDSNPGKNYTEESLISLTREGGIKKRRPTLFHMCSECGFYWVENHCFHNHHLLLKLGKRTMHAPSRQGYDPLWMYVCPACGSDPTPEELSQLRGDVMSDVHDRHEMYDTNAFERYNDDDW